MRLRILKVMGRMQLQRKTPVKMQCELVLSASHALKTASAVTEAFKALWLGAASQTDACSTTDLDLLIILSLDITKMFFHSLLCVHL